MRSATQSVSSSTRRQGFTIVELLIVIVVIGILASIVIVAYNGIQQKARVASLQSDMSNAAGQLEMYSVNNGTYPVSTAAADSGGVLKASPGTAYQYAYTSTSNSYCLTGTNSSVSYFTSTSNPAPQAGACFGHAINGTSIALTCPSGFIAVPGSSTYGTSDFCTMKYEAKQVGATVPISQASGTPWATITQTDAIAYSPNVAGCTGCHLITEAEWLTIAQNVLSVASNWSSGTVGAGYIYSGHNDNSPVNALAADTNDANGYSGTGNSSPSNQRRTLTLTNGEVIWDIAGNVNDWTSGQTSGGQPGASGLTWRQWNTIAGTGSLSSNPHPSYGTPVASNWTSDHGIGQIYSDSSQTGLRGFFRGGYWNDSSHAGVLTLILNTSPSNTNYGIGFRVAR